MVVASSNDPRSGRVQTCPVLLPSPKPSTVNKEEANEMRIL